MHMATCWANVLARFFPKYRDNHAKRNEIISAAVAAGVSVGFGAPVGGVLFSLEEVSTYFSHATMQRAFFCSVIAVAVLSYLNPLADGKLVLFAISYTTSWYGAWAGVSVSVCLCLSLSRVCVIERVCVRL